MNRLSGQPSLAVVCLLACMLSVPAAVAQRARVRIDDISVRQIESPLFDVRTHSRARSERLWLQILISYECEGGDRGWLDEVTFDIAVLFNAERGSPILMRKKLTHLDVPTKGDHHACVYVRPRFLERYYGDDKVKDDDVAVYVQSYANGDRSDREIEASIRLPRNWHEAGEPHVRVFEHELLNRLQTPFSTMDYDFYEHLKSSTP